MRCCLTPSLRKYLRFLLVGGGVGITAIAIREVVALLLPGDTPEYFLLSVIAAYGFGIMASFVLHWRITFGRHHAIGVSVFLRFLGVTLAGWAITSGLSLAIRYLLPTDAYLDAYAGMFSFATSAVCASLFTYLLNSHFVFPAGIGYPRNASDD